MTEHTEKVRYQGWKLEAEKWADEVKSIHVHSLSSMWYDNRPQDTKNGKSVIDTEYNDGLIERRLTDGGIVFFGEKLKGDDLIRAWLRARVSEKGSINYEID